MRKLWIAGFLLALAGCGTDGGSPILGAALGQVTSRIRPAPEAAAPAPRILTREDLEAAGRPVLRLRPVGRPRGTLFYAATQNQDVTGYATPLREYVGMRGSQVVATRALGTDLLRATSSPADPLALPTPPQRWPASVTRVYELPGAGPRGTIERFECRFERGEEGTVTILAREHRGVEMTETCRGPSGSFQNLHFADSETGFVWRSIQWTGPRQGHVDIEIIVPAGL